MAQIPSYMIKAMVNQVYAINSLLLPKPMTTNPRPPQTSTNLQMRATPESLSNKPANFKTFLIILSTTLLILAFVFSFLTAFCLKKKQERNL